MNKAIKEYERELYVDWLENGDKWVEIFKKDSREELTETLNYVLSLPERFTKEDISRLTLDKIHKNLLILSDKNGKIRRSVIENIDNKVPVSKKNWNLATANQYRNWFRLYDDIIDDLEVLKESEEKWNIVRFSTLIERLRFTYHWNTYTIMSVTGISKDQYDSYMIIINDIKKEKEDSIVFENDPIEITNYKESNISDSTSTIPDMKEETKDAEDIYYSNLEIIEKAFCFLDMACSYAVDESDNKVNITLEFDPRNFQITVRFHKIETLD